MTSTDKKKLINTNAFVWATSILVSFVLPMVTDSLTEGRSQFLRAITHVAPLIAAMWITTSLIDRSISPTPED
ncbi:MAG: hypothetical protein R3C01_17390 [Planctomycetaceae bacterium]